MVLVGCRCLLLSIWVYCIALPDLSLGRSYVDVLIYSLSIPCSCTWCPVVFPPKLFRPPPPHIEQTQSSSCRCVSYRQIIHLPPSQKHWKLCVVLLSSFHLGILLHSSCWALHLYGLICCDFGFSSITPPSNHLRPSLLTLLNFNLVRVSFLVKWVGFRFCHIQIYLRVKMSSPKI